MGLGLGVLGRRRGVVGGAREAPVVEVVVRAADRRRGEDGLCGNQPSCGTPEIDFHTASDRELRNAPVVVRVPVVVAEMFVVVGPSEGRVGPGRPRRPGRRTEFAG